jgi:hypothetical protein
LLLPLLSVFAEQLHHAGMRGVRDLHQHQQVVAAEAACALPLAVLGAVEPLERDVEARAASHSFLQIAALAAYAKFRGNSIKGVLMGPPAETTKPLARR